MNKYHLIKHFSKPENGEYVPITFVEFKRKLVGWSPELKRSVYIETEEDKEKLKRIREINIMFAINHMSGKTATIELTDEERIQFEEVYDLLLEKGGQLMYTRKKIGAKTVSFFEIHEAKKRITQVPEKSLLSDRFSV